MRPGEKALAAVAAVEAAPECFACGQPAAPAFWFPMEQDGEKNPYCPGCVQNTAAPLMLTGVFDAERRVLAAQAEVAFHKGNLEAAFTAAGLRRVDARGRKAEMREETRLAWDDRVLDGELLEDELDLAREPRYYANGIRAVITRRSKQGLAKLVGAFSVSERKLVITAAKGEARARPATRAGKAAAMPDSAVVKISDAEWTVASSSGAGSYTVRRDGEAWSCTCPDSTQRSGGDCKHCRVVRRVEAA